MYQEWLTSMARFCLTGILNVGFLTCVSKTIGAREVQNLNVSLTSMVQMCLIGILNVGYCYMCNKYDWSKRKLQNMNVSYVCKQLITTHTIHLPLRHNCFWLAISMCSVVTFITDILQEVAYNKCELQM